MAVEGHEMCVRSPGDSPTKTRGPRYVTCSTLSLRTTSYLSHFSLLCGALCNDPPPKALEQFLMPTLDLDPEEALRYGLDEHVDEGRVVCSPTRGK